MASSLPPGAVVLSMNGTERTELRLGFVAWSAAMLGVGLWLGYTWGRKSHG